MKKRNGVKYWSESVQYYRMAQRFQGVELRIDDGPRPRPSSDRNDRGRHLGGGFRGDPEWRGDDCTAAAALGTSGPQGRGPPWWPPRYSPPQDGLRRRQLQPDHRPFGPAEDDGYWRHTVPLRWPLTRGSDHVDRVDRQGWVDQHYHHHYRHHHGGDHHHGRRGGPAPPRGTLSDEERPFNDDDDNNNKANQDMNDDNDYWRRRPWPAAPWNRRWRKVPPRGDGVAPAQVLKRRAGGTENDGGLVFDDDDDDDNDEGHLVPDDPAGGGSGSIGWYPSRKQPRRENCNWRKRGELVGGSWNLDLFSPSTSDSAKASPPLWFLREPPLPPKASKPRRLHVTPAAGDPAVRIVLTADGRR